MRIVSRVVTSIFELIRNGILGMNEAIEGPRIGGGSVLEPNPPKENETSEGNGFGRTAVGPDPPF